MRQKSRSEVMFAVPSPQDIGLIEAEKVAQIAVALDAKLELFHCVFDADVVHSDESVAAKTEEEIRQLVLNGRQALERIADHLRANGVSARTSVRWDHPVHEGIVRQVLRHKPLLLIIESSGRERVSRLLAHTDRSLIEACPCPPTSRATSTPTA